MADARKHLQKVLFVICALLLAWMVWRSGVSNLWQNLLDWNWVLLACIVVWAVGYLLNTVSFMQIIRCYLPKPMPPCEAIRMGGVLTLSGYALNYVTPFGLLGGEPWRIFHLRKVMDHRSANSAVAYYAMMHVLSHIVFWMIGAVYAMSALEPLMNRYWRTVCVTIVLVVVLLIGLIYLCHRKGWIGNLWTLLQEHPREFWSALLLELASRMVNVIEYWLLLSAAFPDSVLDTYGAAYLVVAFSSLFANILFFSPLQMGTREGGILLILMAFLPNGIETELLPIAVSISFATRIREFFWIGVGLLLMRFGPLGCETNIH